MFEVGRVCMKTAGRESGKYCVVIKELEEGFVMVTGPKSLTKVKRRRCNINHLEPMMEKIKIKSDASDTEVLKAYQQASVFARLGLEKGKKPKAEKSEKAEPEKPEKREHKEERKKVHKEKKREHKPVHKEKKVKHEKKPAKKEKAKPKPKKTEKKSAKKAKVEKKTKKKK